MNNGNDVIEKEKIFEVDDVYRSIKVIIDRMFKRMFDDKEDRIGRRKL